MKVFAALLLAVLFIAGCTSSPSTPQTPEPQVPDTPSPPVPVEPSYTAVVTSAPASIAAGNRIEFSWSVTGPAGRASHTDIWYGTTSNPGVFDTSRTIEDSGYPTQTVTAFDNGADVPDTYSGGFVAPASGTIYYRALAIVNNKYYWSPEGKIPIIAQAPPADDVAEFSVSASQFAFSPAVMQVKKGQKVRITLTSSDTTHGFAISEFGVNQVVAPGAPVTVEFTADQVGSFQTFCSVPCGSGHQAMRGTLVVTE